MTMLRLPLVRIALGALLLVAGASLVAPGQGESASKNLLANPGMEEGLADHPWMPAADIQPLVTADRSFCPPPREGDLSDGTPSSVYRPPRLILS